MKNVFEHLLTRYGLCVFFTCCLILFVPLKTGLAPFKAELAPAELKAQHFEPEEFADPTDFYFQIGDVDEDGDPEVLESGAADVEGTIALGDRDPREVIARIINVILGFLGIIAVIIILVAGLKIMTSGGNEDKKGEAYRTLAAGIIGLIIVLSAYAIARFVLNSLVSATAVGTL